MYRSPRSLGTALAAACVLAASLVVAAPASASPAPASARAARMVGGTGPCTRARGVLVAVSFRRWHGPIVRGCGLRPANGIRLLKLARFTVRGTRQDGPAFVCRIGHPRFRHGRRFPTPAQDPCVRTPPANAFWSYWTAARGHDRWQFSRLGAAGHHPKPGEVDAWVFGAGGRPGFAPHRVRAGLRGSPSSAVTVAAVTGARPDLAAATGYLTKASNLVDGTRYAAAGTSSTDYGLTMDAAIALAASGAADDTVRAVSGYVFAHADRYTGIGTSYASGGGVGKEALLAEITGVDPRSVHGHDLVAALDSLVCGPSASSGCAGSGNYRYAQSTFAQALGVIAQLRAGDTTGAAHPLAFLEGLQHGSGAFPSVLPGTDSDVDSTAAASMALELAGDGAASRAATRALAWIAGRQLADGSFPGAAGHSSNSTGLAVQALSSARSRYRTAIARANAFLAREQNPDGGFAVASGSTGSDLRATTQVVSGAAGTPLGTLTDDVHQSAATLHRARAASYLAGSLVHGTHLEFAGGKGPNYGGTADLAVALAAAGGHDDTLRAVVRYLAGHADAYVDPKGKQSFPGPFAGAAGKLAVLAEITGQDPTAFGGIDLVRVLTGNVCTGPQGGQFGPCSAKGDFYQAFSTVGQAFGVLALARAGVAVPSAALHRLIGLQCADGGFSSTLITGPSRCTSDVDSTGFAIQALARVPSATPAVIKAAGYLRSHQRHDGGWLGAAGENSNSTALAIQGLIAARTGAARVQRALPFLAALQNRDGGFGISAASPGTDPLATTQTVPAIYHATLSRLSHPVQLGHPGGGPSPSAPGTPTGSAPATSPSTTSSGPPPSTPASRSTGGLAATGSASGPLAGIAAALIVLGIALTVLTRSRRTARGHRH